MEVTLFKIDLDGAQLTANAPFSGLSGSDSDTSERADSEDAGPESTAGGRGKGKLAGASVIGLVFLGAVAAVVRKLRERGPTGESAESDVDLAGEVTATSESAESGDDTQKGKGKLAGASIVGLLFLFVAVVVTRKVRGGGDGDEDVDIS